MRFYYKKRLFFIGTFVFGTYLFISYLPWGWFKRTKEVAYYYTYKPDVFIDLPHVFLHLDLKGAPPDIEYLIYAMSEVKFLGVTGLLIEYEDMFPYEGRLANLSSKNAYEKPDLVDFLGLMVDSGFEIVPLIQTFGHLEHALKLPEFKHLRENELYPDSICPSHPETKELLTEMIQQIVDFHKDVVNLTYLHIGCDEVYHLKKCDLCKKSSFSPVELYLNHVRDTIKIVKKLSPNTTVLYWHDLLLQRDPLLLDPINLDAEPVAWAYRPDVGIDDLNFFKYPPDISKVWVASAFKGADGRTSVLPNITRRMENNFNMLKTILEYGLIFRGRTRSRNYIFEGIILTGWSRYSHMAPICDLYSASHSSAIACLLLIKEFKHGVAWSELSSGFQTFYKNRLERGIIDYFNCNPIIPEEAKFCSSVYWRLNSFLRYYGTIKDKITHFYSSVEDGFDSLEYYFNLGMVDLNALNMFYFTCTDFMQNIISIEISVAKYMGTIYDNATIHEYVNSLTYQLKNKLLNTIHTIENVTQVKTWNRRSEEQFTRKLVDFNINGSRT